SAEYVVAGVGLLTVQTTAVALGWYSILRFAYPRQVRAREVIACYGASVALNGILPANIGTLAMLLMFTAIIAAATFAAILGALVVQKIFFTLAGTFVYLYLFLTVDGSFDIKFEFVHAHPWATAVLVAGGAYVIYLLARRLWPRVLRWWRDAKEGGAILVHPGAYLGRVFLPELVGWAAGLGVIAVFLAAHSIPATFETLMRISGSSSIANVTSVTPGSAGVMQAFNVASLQGDREPDRRDRILRRPAARHDRVEHRLRRDRARLGVRLERRQDARRRLLRAGEAAGRAPEGGARGGVVV